MKMAAAEGLYESADECAPFSILTVGTPDGLEERFAITVPCLLSYLGTGSFDGPVRGIDELRAEYRETYGQDPGATYYTPEEYTPIIPVTYWTFRWMIGFGVAGALGAALILWLTRGGRSPTSRWFPRLAIALPVFLLLGNATGWIFTEMGRQPWVVFGLMTTEHGVSPGVSAGEVWTTLIGFTLVYGVLAVIEVGLIVRFTRKGADPFVEPPRPSLRGRSDEDADEPLTFAY